MLIQPSKCHVCAMHRARTGNEDARCVVHATSVHEQATILPEAGTITRIPLCLIGHNPDRPVPRFDEEGRRVDDDRPRPRPVRPNAREACSRVW